LIHKSCLANVSPIRGSVENQADYGREFSRVTSIASLMLMLDAFIYSEQFSLTVPSAYTMMAD
jgi:hypothetical protein